MPIGPGKYRVKTFPSGKQVRLHFDPSGAVNEAKNLASGAAHTPDEFRSDQAKRQARKPVGKFRKRLSLAEITRRRTAGEDFRL